MGNGKGWTAGPAADPGSPDAGPADAGVAAIEALRTLAGRALLASLPPYDERSALTLSETLRAEHPAELVAAAMTQSRLRARTAPRLGPLAYQLLWTPDAAEQATRASVARWRAGRLAAAGVRRVLDLGAGAGSDAIAFATAGIDVIAVERDPVTAAVLAANAEAAGSGRIRVVRADAADAADAGTLLDGCDAVYADPARRADGRRILDPARWSPPLSLLGAFAARVPYAAAKVGPGIAHELLPDGADAEWVSEAGDVLECSLWWGGLRGPERSEAASRSATLLGDARRGAAPRTLRAQIPPATATVRAPGRYLHEPDGAVIRAGLVAEIAESLGGGLLDATIAYVTTDRPERSPFTTRYAITDVLPFSVKALRAALRERGVGRLTVKKRGTAVTPEQLRPQLRLRGPHEATVVLTRLAGRPYALLVVPD